jgi:hypothetical protein
MVHTSCNEQRYHILMAALGFGTRRALEKALADGVPLHASQGE